MVFLIIELTVITLSLITIGLEIRDIIYNRYLYKRKRNEVEESDFLQKDYLKFLNAEIAILTRRDEIAKSFFINTLEFDLGEETIPDAGFDSNKVYWITIKTPLEYKIKISKEQYEFLREFKQKESIEKGRF